VPKIIRVGGNLTKLCKMKYNFAGFLRHGVAMISAAYDSYTLAICNAVEEVNQRSKYVLYTCIYNFLYRYTQWYTISGNV